MTIGIDFSQILGKKTENRYLEGKLLVATPFINKGIFANSVIYLFAHTILGAMGLIINKPIKILQSGSLFSQFDVEDIEIQKKLPISYGGPIDEHRGFIIHSSDYSEKNTMQYSDDISITATGDIIKVIAEGKNPKDKILSLGYAGWIGGQLEQEITDNIWIVVPASKEIIFHKNNDIKWNMAAMSLGIDMDKLSYISGNA